MEIYMKREKKTLVLISTKNDKKHPFLIFTYYTVGNSILIYYFLRFLIPITLFLYLILYLIMSRFLIATQRYYCLDENDAAHISNIARAHNVNYSNVKLFIQCLIINITEKSFEIFVL